MPPKVRRREPRKRGLYYHSTPPKVIPANETKHVERRFRNKTQANTSDVFVVKPSNIRIWIHDKDIAKLTRVLWSGQGFRLLNETSTHGKVRKFLENVPLVLNAVKEIHAAVIENNTEQLQFLLELPPPAIITTKDQNGLTVAHKAAGLGHPEMLDFIVKTWPQGSQEIDKTGKTPLHWSALAKDNQNSIQEMLMQNFGVQEDVLDYKMKTPAYYKTKPQELEKSFLTLLPSAPRIQRHQVVDWGLLEDDIGDLNGSRPMDKIVVEKKKKSIEREDQDIDPDLEESAKKAKNNLDENKSQSDIIEKVAPISKILQNGKIPNGNIITNENNNTEYLSTPIKDINTINSIQNGDLVNGNLIMNGDEPEHESISLEPSPSPLSLSDTPDQTFENTPITIKQIDTPDIQEIKTPSLQMVQSDESLKDNLETNSTNNEQDEENLTTNISNEQINLNEDSDEKLHDENLNNDDDNVQNEIETDKLENVDIINSDNNSDIVNNSNDNLNNESTNEELTNQENDDGNNEPLKDEPDNETNEVAEIESEEQENNETNENNIENDEIKDNDETNETEDNNELIETEDNNELKNENIEENNESNENETKIEENENENQDDQPTDNIETIENNEETEIKNETETEKIENDAEEINLDDNNVEAENENESKEDENVDTEIENESKQDANVENVENELENVETETKNENKQEENNNDENVENESENVEKETENENKQDENNNNENVENESENVETEAENENKQDENNNNNENELNTNDKPDDGEESDDENSLNDSMDQLDYEAGSTDGTHNTSFRSPSSPSISHDIEGFVHGEPDDNQVQSQSTEMDIDEETKINEIIKSGDMEQLASIVLNGQGNKLLGAKSSQPEIQAFLDNVPSYMSKISRVHQSARDGNLRELQAALDRRKFAIARNEISPKGATPLHVSAIFGHSGIVRYLAGRFPETTTIVDEDGRTPLHYAATINDNGHFYNLLVHFGSNPKATDKLGNTPEYYKDHKSTAHILSHKQLLKSFGANETLETEMFSDQVPDDVHSARKYLDDEDVITTLERCFKLINESTLTPNATNNNNSSSSVSSLRLNITTYLARFLKRSVFDKIKYRQTKLDHNLFDIIWPAMKKSSKEKRIDEDLNSGVVAPDYDVFVVFQEFFIPLIKDMHCLNLSQELKPHPRLFYFPLIDGEKDEFINYDIDDSSKYVSELYVECTRNLDEFELPLNLNIGQIEHAERVLIEKILTTEFAKAIGEPEAGIYYTMNEVLESPSEIRHVLENSKLMIPLLDSREPEQEAECHAINGMFWPYGRGVFISHQGDLAAWINVQDHLRIIVGAPNSQPTNIGYAYSKVGRAITFLEGNLHFRESYFLGYLSSRPSFLGAALKISAILELPNLMKEIDNLRHLCIVRGLHMIPELESKNKINTIGNNIKNSQEVDIPLFKTEQGQYLAASKWLDSLIKHKPKKSSINLPSDLGDPLVKALTEIVEKRPDDPIEFLINYLQDYVQVRNQNGGKKPINGLTNHINGVVTQQGLGSQSSAIPTKPDPPSVGSVGNSVMSRQESETKLDAEAEGTDDDNLSDSIVLSEDRDEHGQSMLHFACARSHGRNALISLIDESNIDITYRDELYRTARDVSLQANQPGNAKEIDRYVLSLAANGDDKPFQHMLINGYDHILDVEDEDGNTIFDICRTRASSEISRFLDKVRSFEENREQVHAAIRLGQLDTVEELTIVAIGSQLIKAKNYYGRTALHIAVLKENEDIVEYIASNFPETIKIGDNLERTPLHYAMGVKKVENVSRILINKGAKRTAKDLKGRQPSYYFINKSDILRLQEEESEER